MSKKTESVHALTAALGTALAAIDSLKEENNALVSSTDASVVLRKENVEKLGRDRNAAIGTQAASSVYVSEASKERNMEDTEGIDKTMGCTECKFVKSTSRGDKLRVCMSCKITVHEKCYAVALPLAEEKRSSTASKRDMCLSWKCDPCRRGVDPRGLMCSYCGIRGGDQALKLLDKDGDNGFWMQYNQFIEQTVVDSERYGHVLCINWDPRRLAAHIVKESKIKPFQKVAKKESAKEVTIASENDTGVAIATDDSGERENALAEEIEEVVPDVSEVLMRDPVIPGECCFCHLKAGVRIQCRRAHCGQFFHAMCAHKEGGHVELRTGFLVQFHAYCKRHRTCTEDISDLLAKLVTRPIRLLVGRDDMRRFATISKHLHDYTSAATVVRDLAALIVGYCHKSLRTSKSDPPDYNVKHLQVLKFFLSHVPQLEKVYALPPTPLQDLVNDKKLFRRLDRTFDPPRYLAKYPGPLSQQYTCDVCSDPFHERQHLFYCSGKDVSHVQHWRCTKSQTTVRERERSVSVMGTTGTKKKRNAISIVQNGLRKDITLPKDLPSMTVDITCGVCCAPVDTRDLIAFRKEAKPLDFEKKESKFVQSGCYINPGGAKGQNGYSFSSGSTTSSRKPPRPNDGKHNGNFSLAPQVLAPPKMERINVQRTTRWLACVAQIIRQAAIPAALTAVNTVLASKPAASGSVADVTVMSAAPSAVDDTIGSSKDAETESTSTASKSAALNESATADAVATLPVLKQESNCILKAEPEAEEALTPAMPLTSNTRSSTVKDASLVTPAMQILFDEAMRLVQPYDAYAQNKLETAHDFLVHRSGPGVAVLRMLTHEYTRFVYIKHTRAVEKARNEKRKRAEHEAQEHREKERKRINLEAERALKKQMLAMRNKQRQHLKATSAK